MIIKRKFVSFGVLYNTDPKSKKIIDSAFFDNDIDKKEQQRIFEYNYDTKVYNWELGCGIPNPKIIIEGFERLDISDPYDNKLTYDDVRDINIICAEEDYIHYLLVSYSGQIIKSIEDGNIDKFSE